MGVAPSAEALQSVHWTSFFSIFTTSIKNKDTSQKAKCPYLILYSVVILNGIGVVAHVNAERSPTAGANIRAKSADILK